MEPIMKDIPLKYKLLAGGVLLFAGSLVAWTILEILGVM